MPDMLLLAQTIDPLAGNSGWVGAGLLGMVLGWLLLKHLPDKDRQMQWIIEKHDERTESLVDKFKMETAAEREQCVKLHDEVMQALTRDHEAEMKAIGDLHHSLRGHRGVVEPGYAKYVTGPEGQMIPNPLPKLEG